MKKILIAGAAGSVGVHVISELLKEKKYEITALDMSSKKIKAKLKKYKKKINIICGDITDEVLIKSLIKTHDIVINLCTAMPPLSDYKTELSEIVEYEGTKKIIKAIKEENPKCFLVYGSTTSLYGEVDYVTVNSKVNKKELSPFNLNKYKSEELIKKELNNFVILRFPLILNEIAHEPFMFNIKKNTIIECITNYDAASAVVKSLDKTNKLNKKIFNVGGGENYRIIYNEILRKILKYQGLSVKYVLSRVFLDKNYYSPVLDDSDELEKIIKFRGDSLTNYFNRLKRKNKKRVLALLAGKFILMFNKKKR